MEVVPAALLLALVVQFVNFLKYVKAGDKNGIFTQLIAWVSGVGGVFLIAQTDWASTVDVGAFTLATLNGWSLFVLGLLIASGGGLAVEFKKALDDNDSAAKPNFLPD